MKYIAIVIVCAVVGVIGFVSGAPDTLVALASGAIAVSVAGLFSAPRTKRTCEVANTVSYRASAKFKEYTVYGKVHSRGVFVSHERRATLGSVWAPSHEDAQTEARRIHGRDAWTELVIR